MTEIKSSYMIDFKPIRIEDKELITTYFFACGNRDCNLSFVNLYTWQFLTNSHYAVVDDCLVVRFTLDEESVVYTMPVGTGDVKNVDPADIGLICNDQRRGDGIGSTAGRFVMQSDSGHDLHPFLQGQICLLQNIICKQRPVLCMMATVHRISDIVHESSDLHKFNVFFRIPKFFQNLCCPL